MPHTNKQHDDAVVKEQVQQLLDRVPAYQALDPATRRALSQSMASISGYLAGTSDPSGAPVRQLGPGDLRDRLGRGSAGTAPAAPGASGAPGVGAPGTAPGDISGAAPATGPVGRVGEVARATLNAVSFPSFVGSLIQGTFRAIVDSSIEQMQAYAELVQNVSGTVDEFMQDNISDGHARDYLADRFDGFMVRDTSGQTPRLTVDPSGVQPNEMPSFFRDLGFESPDDIDDDAIEEVIVPETRRTLAEQRQQVLATMVLMGINRIVVDDGEINAKLQFHIDASEETELRFDQNKILMGDISGGTSSPYTANGLLVNTTSLNAQSDINIRTDLTGQVKVKFRSETFPLERFADSMAIQLINSNARVPGSPAENGDADSSAPVADDPWAT